MTIFTAACVQLRATRNLKSNIEQACDLIEQAAKNGAHYIQTPEQTSLMELDREFLFKNIEIEENDLALKAFIAHAQKLKIWLHIGSISVLVGTKKAANRSFLINPSGVIVARYDKIHMFDVQLENGEHYKESDGFQAGKNAVVAQLPWGKIGLGICYDIRFPNLFRAQAHAGAQFLTVPAAFTKTTGEAHWHVLLRARAIENGAFVFAAGQGGHHENGRDTFGHSIIISPWGKIIAEAGIDPCYIMAEINPQDSIEARRQIPALLHERKIEIHTL